MVGFSKQAVQPVLFDIRLKSSDHDILLIKGPPSEAASVLLSGTVVLALNEPLHLKKLTVRLYGHMRLNLQATYNTAKGPVTRPYRHDKRFYEYVWANIDLSRFKTVTRSHSGLFAKAKSTTSLMNLGSSDEEYIIPEGNYEFPFSAILPGDTIESVEGLPSGSVVYKLSATIERGKHDLSAKKHIRVVRTLTPDSTELTETMAVDNTWPQKVEYSISVPTKAIVIGSSTPVSIVLVPLVKGLRLGPVTLTLVEYASCCAPMGPPHNTERDVVTQTLDDPLPDQDETYYDRWEVQSWLPLPHSLSKVTQDCTIMNNIKVRHKIKFNISLVNPDGHVSELRASLPVQLFISPFVPLGVKTVDVETNSKSSSVHNSDDDDDDEIFSRGTSEVNLVSGQQNPGLEAPPLYGFHTLDTLWDDVSIEGTPSNSGTASGRHTPSRGASSALNMSQLSENLAKLQVERDEEDDSEGLSFATRREHPVAGSSRPGPMTIPVPQGSEVQGFASPMAGLRSPGGHTPEFNHMSRSNSFIFDRGNVANSWDKKTISRVPSYVNAMKSDLVEDEDLPPVYPDEDRQAFMEPPRPMRAASATHLGSHEYGVSPRRAGSRPGFSVGDDLQPLHGLTRAQSSSFANLRGLLGKR